MSPARKSSCMSQKLGSVVSNEVLLRAQKSFQVDINVIQACIFSFYLQRRSSTSPNVLSVCQPVEILPFNVIAECSMMHAECSRMLQNACRMFQNACRMFQNAPECIQNVRECYRNHAVCSRMHAECSRMFQNACRKF